MGLSLVYGVIAQRTVLCVLWCKTFNDPLHLLTKGMSGCASRIKIGHLFQKNSDSVCYRCFSMREQDWMTINATVRLEVIKWYGEYYMILS